MTATRTKPPEQARGKILRLAFEDRMAFNRMVRDGFQGRPLIKWLAAHGVPGVNAQNLSKYKRSAAYRNWLEEEKQIERDQHDTEQAMRLAEALGGSASDKLKTILAGKLYLFSRDLADPDELKPLIAAFNSVTDAERLQLQRRIADQKDDQLAMQRMEFQRKTCELFLAWFKDKAAADIANSRALDNAAKIEALREHYFADVDEMEKSGKVVLPE